MSAKQKTDLVSLSAALDRQTTGLSPVFHDRLIRVIRALGNERLDRAAIAEKTGLRKRHQLRPVLAAGRRPDLNVLTRHCRGAGMKHGRKPDQYSVNVEGLRACAQRDAAKKRTGTLSAKQVQLLELFNWHKAKFANAYRFVRVAELVTAVGTTRRVSQDELARELGWGVATLKRAKVWAEKAKVLRVRVSYKSAFSSVPSEWTVDWERIALFADGEGVGRGGLDAPRWRRLSDRPSPKGKLSAAQRKLLARLTYEQAHLQTPNQLVLLQMLLASIGESRTVSQPELQREWQVGRSTVERAFELGRKTGYVEFQKKWNHAAGGIRSTCRVDWAKIKAIAGEPASVNGRAKKRTMPKAEKSEAPPLKPRKHGPDATYGEVKKWLLGEIREGRDAEPAVLRARYREQFPEVPLPSAQTRTFSSFVSKARKKAQLGRAPVSPM